MHVHRTSMPPAEAQAFEQAIRASGRDPAGFRTQVFESAGVSCDGLRRVHVTSGCAAAQYEAGTGSHWTDNFARHLARGFFG